MKERGKLMVDQVALNDFAQVLTPASRSSRSRLRVQQTDMKNGVARLVLALIELLRELLERQALRRIEAGSVTEEEIERLGNTFLRLSEQMTRLKKEFGLTDEDLNLDLGPLGKLLPEGK